MSYQRLAKYVVALEAETAKYQAGLEKARKQLGRFEKRQKADIQRMAKQFAVLGVAAATAFTAATKAVVGLADEIAKTAKVVGVSGSALQELRFAAAQTGIEARGLDDSLRRLGRRLGEFANSGAGPAQKALEALGLENKITGDILQDNEKAFYLVVDALQQVESQAQRSALAAQLFGDDFGPKLVPLIDLGANGINRLREEARKLGLVIGDDLLAKSEQLADKMNILNTALRVRISEAILENAAAIEQLTQALIDLVAAAANVPSAWQRFKAQFGFGLEGEFSGIPLDKLEADLREAYSKRADYQEKLNNLRTRYGDGPAGVIAGRWDIEREVAAQNRLIEQLNAEIQRRRELADIPPPSSSPTAISAGAAAAGAGSGSAPFTGPMFPGSAVPERYDDGGWLAGFGSVDQLEYWRDKMMQVTDEMTVYSDQAARNMQTAFADFLFDPFEDGLKGMLKGFVDVLRRMVAEAAASAIFGKFGGEDGVSGFFGKLLGRATGGPVSGGTPYMVGERGPELFIPNRSGSIVPNHAMGGVTVNIDARGSDNPERLLQLLPVIKNSIKAEIYSERRRGISG